MVTHTWGFVKTRPGSPWTKVEVRAERGAILRVSGTSYAAVLASLARIRSAFQGAHVRWPGKALTLHFHPACHASELAQLDLPIALSLLAIQGHVSASSLSRIVSWGMVGLDGEIKAEAHRLRVAPAGASQQPVPNNIVRALGPDPAPWAWSGPCDSVSSLADALGQMQRPCPSLGRASASDEDKGAHSLAHAADAQWKLDWTNLEGEGKAKAWLCIAAKTRMPVLLTGPPGVGKSSLAKAAHGLLSAAKGTQVPFYAPHPSGGTAGLLGSWRRGQPIPGAWALADGGVLFLDEFAEWPRPARESLRHIMETGNLHLHRAEGSAHWQSTAWLLAAMNLCPCGQHPERCVCDTAERKKYRRRLSAPILERFLVQLEVGHAVQEDCDRTWEECVNWVKDPSILTAAEWQVDALDLAELMMKKGVTSKRLRNNIRRLAEGKARWSGAKKVRPSDVQAAFDVTWMNRPGWWNG